MKKELNNIKTVTLNKKNIHSVLKQMQIIEARAEARQETKEEILELIEKTKRIPIRKNFPKIVEEASIDYINTYNRALDDLKHSIKALEELKQSIKKL